MANIVNSSNYCKSLSAHPSGHSERSEESLTEIKDPSPAAQNDNRESVHRTNQQNQLHIIKYYHVILRWQIL